MSAISAVEITTKVRISKLEGDEFALTLGGQGGPGRGNEPTGEHAAFAGSMPWAHPQATTRPPPPPPGPRS